MSSEVAVVILAGGEGRRIGGGKPLLLLGGERLIDRALRQARRWSHCVAIGVRASTQVQPIDAILLADEPDLEGPLAGLIAALKFGHQTAKEFVLTIPSDMPFLPPDLPDRLLAAAGRRACALASSAGHLHPVCGLWRTTVLDEVDHYLGGQKRSLRGLAELVGFATVDWPARGLDPFFNINSADDLARADRLL